MKKHEDRNVVVVKKHGANTITLMKHKKDSCVVLTKVTCLSVAITVVKI